MSDIKLNGRVVEFYVDKNGCHICTSHSRNKQGYPTCMYKGKSSYLHRALYRINFGDIDKGLVVRHKCNNPLCINMDHLCLGTIRDNVLDSVEAGTHKNPIMFGEANGASKISKSDVINIHYMSRNKNMSQSQISKFFNGIIGQSAISMILSGKRWKSVYEEISRNG